MTQSAESAINDANISDIVGFSRDYADEERRELVAINTQAAFDSVEGLDRYRVEAESSKAITELLVEVDGSIAVIEGLIKAYGIRRGES